MLQNSLILRARGTGSFLGALLRPSVEGAVPPRLAGRLRRASGCERRWRTAEELDEPSQVLRSRRKHHFVSGAAQASQSKPIEFEDALHVCKSQLDLLPLAPLLLEVLAKARTCSRDARGHRNQRSVMAIPIGMTIPKTITAATTRRFFISTLGVAWHDLWGRATGVPRPRVGLPPQSVWDKH